MASLKISTKLQVVILLPLKRLLLTFYDQQFQSIHWNWGAKRPSHWKGVLKSFPKSPNLAATPPNMAKEDPELLIFVPSPESWIFAVSLQWLGEWLTSQRKFWRSPRMKSCRVSFLFHQVSSVTCILCRMKQLRSSCYGSVKSPSNISDFRR